VKKNPACCLGCGVSLDKRHRNTQRCFDCQAKRQRESRKDYERKRKEEERRVW
jgi:hypothetical protein